MIIFGVGLIFMVFFFLYFLFHPCRPLVSCSGKLGNSSFILVPQVGFFLVFSLKICKLHIGLSFPFSVRIFLCSLINGRNQSHDQSAVCFRITK